MTTVVNRDRLNHLMNASGSLKEARRLILQYLQETKLSFMNTEDYAELLALMKRLEDIRVTLEVKSHNAG
ncbi:MAG: hypothetical protein ACREVZ_06635 [Burkholderiales bacterium]